MTRLELPLETILPCMEGSSVKRARAGLFLAHYPTPAHLAEEPFPADEEVCKGRAIHHVLKDVVWKLPSRD